MGGKKNYIAIDSSFGKPKFAVPANPQVTTTVPKAAMLRMLSWSKILMVCLVHAQTQPPLLSSPLLYPPYWCVVPLFSFLDPRSCILDSSFVTSCVMPLRWFMPSPSTARSGLLRQLLSFPHSILGYTYIITKHEVYHSYNVSRVVTITSRDVHGMHRLFHWNTVFSILGGIDSHIVDH